MRHLEPLRWVPNPSVTMILEFGGGSPVLDGAAGPRKVDCFVGGPYFGAGGAVRARGDNVECVQLRISPLTARAILGVSPADLGDAAVPLSDLWGRDASRIREQLSDSSSWQDRFALVDALLARRHEADPLVDPEVAWAWRRIVVRHGLTRVDELAAEVGWSRKRLWSRFWSQLGLPPKRAAKLLRFDYAAHHLVAGEAPAPVAADAGYADQSHLHRDFMEFTGATPATVTGEPFLNVDDIAWPSTGERRS